MPMLSMRRIVMSPKIELAEHHLSKVRADAGVAGSTSAKRWLRW